MTDYSVMFIQMVVILGLVCLLAFGFLRYILPRLGFAQRIQKNQAVKVLARCHLDHRHNVVVTQVGSRYFLLGVGDHSVTMLSELSQHDVDAEDK
ncbi:MAG: flagellar biosynthetic protein FliO [Deltaproteobacteria bacterium CG11_big_fil_rev_8_21_14_0_20_47_16]|nr:MAG: flagellar biosynthetic protein FliO [Deltaproteobacteria bacterium CG11_big_fil_rev_8_21_14_0_20_47_16]